MFPKEKTRKARKILSTWYIFKAGTTRGIEKSVKIFYSKIILPIVNCKENLLNDLSCSLELTFIGRKEKKGKK